MERSSCAGRGTRKTHTAAAPACRLSSRERPRGSEIALRGCQVAFANARTLSAGHADGAIKLGETNRGQSARRGIGSSPTKRKEDGRENADRKVCVLILEDS